MIYQKNDMLKIGKTYRVNIAIHGRNKNRVLHFAQKTIQILQALNSQRFSHMFLYLYSVQYGSYTKCVNMICICIVDFMLIVVAWF